MLISLIGGWLDGCKAVAEEAAVAAATAAAPLNIATIVRLRESVVGLQPHAILLSRFQHRIERAATVALVTAVCSKLGPFMSNSQNGSKRCELSLCV